MHTHIIVAIREGIPGVLDECHPSDPNPGQCNDCVCPNHCQVCVLYYSTPFAMVATPAIACTALG